MIARAPHLVDGDQTETFKADNVLVWEKISSFTREEECWTYVKPAQRSRNGRLAFQNLYNHYLGPNNVNNMATEAETRLQSVTYSGEKKRWNFEKYVRTHADQHSILQGLTGHGHAGIDEGSKVRHLIAGIKTTALDSVKTQIMADTSLRVNFDVCVSLYKDFIKQSSALPNPTIGISAMNVEKNGKTGNKRVRFDEDEDVTVEDCYYTSKEYNKLTSAQKYKLSQIRKACGNKPNKKQKKEGSQTLKKMTKQIAALTAALVNSVGLSQNGSQSSEDGDASQSGDATSGTNRNNLALTRQRRH